MVFIVLLAGLTKFEVGVVRTKGLSGEYVICREERVQSQVDDSIDIFKFR